VAGVVYVVFVPSPLLMLSAVRTVVHLMALPSVLLMPSAVRTAVHLMALPTPMAFRVLFVIMGGVGTMLLLVHIDILLAFQFVLPLGDTVPLL
jgi:hypothetical protein